MKKLALIFLLVLIVGIGVVGWIFLGPATGFDTKTQTLYIGSHAATKQAVLDSLEKKKIIAHLSTFNWLADRMNYWTAIKPGKYEIRKGSSLITILRMLRNGRQTPVNLVITKLRTKEDFAHLAGSKFEFDSAQVMAFLNNNDSLQSFDVDTSTVLSLVLPDTYTYFWNTTPHAVFQKLAAASKKFWTEERRHKAKEQGLTPEQAYILASIIEEETTNNAEKGNVASVYINRNNRGMPLQADPTVKYALKNFALKRIYEKYTLVASPYNTYRNKGLPPGPICTPSQKTIEAVLNAPKTDYLYFVARPDVRETHDFSVSYEEHLKKARLYQQALNQRDSIQKAKEQSK